MTKLLLIKEKLVRLYAKSGNYIRHVIQFALAFISFFLIGKEIGSDSLLTSPLICLAAALICAFLPINATVVIASLLIIVDLFGLSVELAIIATAVLLIIYLLYFRFAPKTGFIVILTPILFFLHVPYLIPVIAALTVGFSGIIPMICGTFIYFLIDFSSNYSTAISTLDADNIMQNITFIFNNILNNKELIVIIVTFSVVMMIIYLIKRTSVNYAWIIAIIAGCVLDAIIQIVAFSVMAIDYSVLWMILGHVLAIGIGLLLHLFLFSVDYTATEYVQFEDNDYYYYVKAVPKVSVTSGEVRVKQINAARNAKGYVHTEAYEDPETEQDADAMEEETIQE